MSLDASVRSERIKKATAGLVALNERLAGPRSRMRDRVAVTQAVLAVLQDAGAARWIKHSVTESAEQTYRQKTQGRPGANTDHVKETRMRFGIESWVDDEAVKADANSDGCFPLITNDKDMTPIEPLDAYKYQPNLERRHVQLKGTQLGTTNPRPVRHGPVYDFRGISPSKRVDFWR